MGDNRLRRNFVGDSIEDLASIRTRRYTSTIRSTREEKPLGGERKTLREGKTPIREGKHLYGKEQHHFRKGKPTGTHRDLDLQSFVPIDADVSSF